MLSVWTIYKYPEDYPDCYTARRFSLSDGTVEATSDLLIGKTLEDVRNQLPKNLKRLMRDIDDDPVIVESWL